MPDDRDGALLAHIADTVTEIRQEQSVVVEVLSQLVATVGAHTEMLAEILGAARQEAGPSDTARLLRELVDAVQANTATIGTLAEQLGTLPSEIGAEVGRAMGQGPEPSEA